MKSVHACEIENMQFRQGIFIWFVFAKFFFKFNRNVDIQELFFKLNIEDAGVLQIFITLFLYTLQ